MSMGSCKVQMEVQEGKEIQERKQTTVNKSRQYLQAEDLKKVPAISQENNTEVQLDPDTTFVALQDQDVPLADEQGNHHVDTLVLTGIANDILVIDSTEYAQILQDDLQIEIDTTDLPY